MDRKNFILGMACIVGAFALFFLSKPAPQPAAAAPVAQTAVVPPALKPQVTTALPTAVARSGI